jgi:single-stranded-DNA-specific exonuclease
VSSASPPKPSHEDTRWVLKSPPPGFVAEPGGGLPPVVEAILATRGIGTAAEREAFLNPKLGGLSDPFLLPDMAAAVERVFAAVDAHEKVALYGDYDVDGVTSLTLLKTILTSYGIDAGTFLPHRIDEGYGLSIDGLERCLEENSPQLLIAVDCGTTSIEQADWLAERGVELIILDHHEASLEGRPKCCALVNPKAGIDGQGEEFSYLCSAGVVFKLAHALLKTRPNDEFDLRDYLDIVAVGTVADIVPLVDENRALVRRGLFELARTRNYGLASLAEVAGVNPPYGAMDIGFRIGPRLNAAGRLDTAGAALDLLLCDDPAEARILAEELDERNKERQDVERQTADEVMAMIESGGAGECGHAIVVGKRGWHPGVVGIVASRVSRKYYRPTFIIAIDDETGIGKGSGRSVEGVSLVDAINTGREHLESGGGHAMAAGISVHEDNLTKFRKHLNRHVRENADPEDLKPLLKLDAECRFAELRLELLDTYRHLEPFGSKNPEPVLLAKRVYTTSEPRVMKDKHYRLTLIQDGSVCDAIYFSGVEHGLPPQPWDVAFTLLRNDFRGRVSLQMNIRALREAE